MKNKSSLYLILGFFGVLLASSFAHAQMTMPTVNLGYKTVNDPKELVTNIKIILMLTILTLAPAIVIMMTSFTRIVIVLSFVRQALGTQNMPPNQLLIGLSLFITLFVMSPFLNQINNEAVQPFLNNTIKQEEAIDKALAPIRGFMFNQTRDQDLELFVSLSKMDKPRTRAEVPTHVLIPAFIISELKTAFQIGFIIYLPFLVIDMVAASVLMAMGMMMLPPVIISLPFKIMLFVLVDGWGLIIGSLVKSFG
ncbi:MAG: flagellar type III secretion system pore protein FliP [Bdellovibrionota bacterium]